MTAQHAIDRLTETVIGLAIEVHKALGPGLLESAYESCLCHEMEAHRVPFARQVSGHLIYKGLALQGAYRMDLVVDERLIVELKAVDQILPVHQAQVLTYMRLSGLKTGLLLNFNIPMLKNGIRRFVM